MQEQGNKVILCTSYGRKGSTFANKSPFFSIDPGFDSDVRQTIQLHFEHAKPGQALLAALVHQKSRDYRCLLEPRRQK